MAVVFFLPGLNLALLREALGRDRDGSVSRVAESALESMVRLLCCEPNACKCIPATCRPRHKYRDRSGINTKDKRNLHFRSGMVDGVPVFFFFLQLQVCVSCVFVLCVCLCFVGSCERFCVLCLVCLMCSMYS